MYFSVGQLLPSSQGNPKESWCSITSNRSICGERHFCWPAKQGICLCSRKYNCRLL